MMLAGFLFLLFITVDGESSEGNCSYQDVLNHLNFTKNKELFSMLRPVKHYKTPTNVTVDVLLRAILDVRELDQTFVPYIWIYMMWENEHIQWEPEDFCGIKEVSIPSEVLWKPDITIEEIIEKDKASPSPHLIIFSDGIVFVKNDQVLVTMCRMQVFKFPFDIQTCTLTFKSVVYSDEQIKLITNTENSDFSWYSMAMRTEFEWLLIKMTVHAEPVTSFEFTQDQVIFTISMKRRSAIYIINFLLPILLFLSLDLASFLISDSGGEKLSFKVTMLLAVTVMQLILNEILPSSSERIPLIVVFCIGIFTLMMLSLLETILVMYLTDKDSASQDSKTDQSQSDGNKQDKKKWTSCLCDLSADETPIELLKGSSSQLMEEAQVGEGFSDELREVLKTLVLILNSRKEEEKPGYWTRMTKTINKVFFIFYVVAASLFLICMLLVWTFAT